MPAATCRVMAMNVGDLATLSTTVAPYSTTPAKNLQNPRRARVLRFPAAGGQSIKGTWGGQGWPVSMVGLDWFNFEPAATVRFRGFQNADWTGTTLIDTGTVAPYNAAALGSFTWGKDPLGTSIFDGFQGHKYWVAYFAEQTIQSFQIDVSDATNSWQYNEISRLVVGSYLELSINAAMGLKFSWKEATEQTEGDGGSLASDGRVPRRAISGNLEHVIASERLAWANLMRLVGKRKQFAVSFQAGEGADLERDYTILGAKFQDVPELSWDYAASWGMPFTIVES